MYLNSGSGQYETLNALSYNSGSNTLNLATPLLNVYTGSNTLTIGSSWSQTADTDLMLTDCSFYNFGGDLTVYLGQRTTRQQASSHADFRRRAQYGEWWGKHQRNASGLFAGNSDSDSGNLLLSDRHRFITSL